MNNEEINRYIHREIMQICQSPDPECDCVPADYTSDDSPRRLLHEVEANVIEHLRLTVKNPNVIYCRYLMVVNGFSYEDLGYLYEQVIRSTAEQRARACVEAHKLTAKPAA